MGRKANAFMELISLDKITRATSIGLERRLHIEINSYAHISI